MRCRMLFGVRLSSEQPRLITGAAYVADWSAELSLCQDCSQPSPREQRGNAELPILSYFKLSRLCSSLVAETRLFHLGSLGSTQTIDPLALLWPGTNLKLSPLRRALSSASPLQKLANYSCIDCNGFICQPDHCRCIKGSSIEVQRSTEFELSKERSRSRVRGGWRPNELSEM